MATALFLGEDVNLARELLVRGDALGSADHLATLNVVLFDATQKHADVVTGNRLIERLLELLDAGDGGGLVGDEADDFGGVTDLGRTTLDATRGGPCHDP